MYVCELLRTYLAVLAHACLRALSMHWPAVLWRACLCVSLPGSISGSINLLTCAPALFTCSHALLRYAPAHMRSYAMHLSTSSKFEFFLYSIVDFRWCTSEGECRAHDRFSISPSYPCCKYGSLYPCHHWLCELEAMRALCRHLCPLSAAGSTGEGMRRHGCTVVKAPCPALWDYKTKSTLSADYGFSGNMVERGGRRARGSTSWWK